jgi:hypothetical protein
MTPWLNRAARPAAAAANIIIIIVRPEGPSSIVRPEPHSGKTKLRRRPAAAQRRPRRQRVGPIAGRSADRHRWLGAPRAREGIDSRYD